MLVIGMRALMKKLLGAEGLGRLRGEDLGIYA